MLFLLLLSGCREERPGVLRGEIKGLTARLVPPFLVHLEWEDDFPEGTGFAIHRSIGHQGQWELLATVYTHDYYDSTVTLDAEYAYQIIPEYEGRKGAPSRIVTIRTPSSPLPLPWGRETYILEHPEERTSSQLATFNFTAVPMEEGVIFLCQLDAAPPYYCFPPLTLSGVSEGEHRFRVAFVEANGVSDPTPAAFTWTVDLTPPLLRWFTPPPDLLYGFQSLGFFASEPAVFSCSLNGQPFSPCTSPLDLRGFPFGNYTLLIEAHDLAGNRSTTPLSASFWLAQDPPETVLEEAPLAPFSTLPVTIRFSGSHPQGLGGFQCSLGGNPWVPCSSPLSITALPQGDSWLLIRALSRTGEPDPTPLQVGLQYLPLAPETLLLWHSPRFTPVPTQAVEFLGGGGEEIHCSLDGGSEGICGESSLFALTAGTHTLSAWAVSQGISDPTPALVTWTVIAPDLVARDIAPGYDHACLVHPGGSLYCWGSNSHGQLGTGDLLDASSPQEVPHPFGGQFQNACTGMLHSCSRDDQGGLFCFGSNDYGQLGLSSPGIVTVPTQVAGVTDAVEVACGGFHTCLRTAQGSVYCTGFNPYGNLGDGTTETRFGFVPVTLPAPACRIYAGRFHTCALSCDGTPFCWGWNGWGQLGTGDLTEAHLPVTAGGGIRFLTLALGDTHTCGVGVTQEAYCFGDNRSGAVNMNPGMPALVSQPVSLSFPFPVTAVAVGSEHSCFLRQGGIPYCFGSNLYGQLGVVPDEGFPLPVSTAWEFPWLSLMGKGRVTCGIRAGDLPYCFGTSSFSASRVPAYIGLSFPGR